MQEVSNHTRSMSWPKQRLKKARNSDALSASARTTKRAVTGRSRRRRPVRSKIAKQKSQEGRKKRMNIRTKELLAVPICCTPASRRDWRAGSHQYTVNRDCMFGTLLTHQRPTLDYTSFRRLYHLAQSAICSTDWTVIAFTSRAPSGRPGL